MQSSRSNDISQIPLVNDEGNPAVITARVDIDEEDHPEQSQQENEEADRENEEREQENEEANQVEEVQQDDI